MASKQILEINGNYLFISVQTDACRVFYKEVDVILQTSLGILGIQDGFRKAFQIQILAIIVTFIITCQNKLFKYK